MANNGYNYVVITSTYESIGYMLGQVFNLIKLLIYHIAIE